MNQAQLLIENGFLPLAAADLEQAGSPDVAALGTVLSNMAHYGFMPSAAAVTVLQGLDAAALGGFWQEVEPALQTVTGADREMDRFVVYKNFPGEVLAMSQATYWTRQILMYLGLPAQWVAEPEAERPAMALLGKLKVLDLADGQTLANIERGLLSATTRWTDTQRAQAEFLVAAQPPAVLDVDACGFRENGIRLAAVAFHEGIPVQLTAATDVLRLAAALSAGDPGLRGAVKFRQFTRGERRRLAKMLESCAHLDEDFSLRPEPWKRLLSRLHPGEFSVPQVSAAYDRLYRGVCTGFAAQVEHGLRQADVAVLDVLARRPGDFLRRLHKAYAVFGERALSAFLPLVGGLGTGQLLKLDGYLATINTRARLVYAPQGNWTKMQVAENAKASIPAEHIQPLRNAISEVVGARLRAGFPVGFDVAPDAALVKLPTNDQKLASYGRGTVFPLPEEVGFIRSASFWAHPTEAGHIWYDNGWNFFDDAWRDVGTICWNHTETRKGGCVFSGDPTNGNELKGRGCQMIDLNLDRLAASGVRYAVWSILAFSRTPFASANDVLATLQWGDKPETGKLYEPARAQMVFPLVGENLTKYVAYLDLRERRLVYVDANLYGNVQSAGNNGALLAERFPAFLEYLDSLPSVADLFGHAGGGAIPVYYSDADAAIPAGPAYVFDRRNAASTFDGIDLRALLGDRTPPVVEPVVAPFRR